MSIDIIQMLDLKPHEEGGYYRRTYTSEFKTKINNETRSIASAIYYYLASDDFSAWHRIRSDEMWHFYCGSDLMIHYIDAQGELKCTHLGHPREGSVTVPQFVVPANTWFAAEVGAQGSYSLVGCTCFPEFDYKDFELADAKKLGKQYPQHEDIIQRLTR